MVEWESGEVTYEPLTLISKDDPITCAVYAKKDDSWHFLAPKCYPALWLSVLPHTTTAVS